MGRPKLDDEMKEEMKTLFTKGMLACEEIGRRYGMSRQGVNLVLTKMGLSTAKRKFIVPCSVCGTPVEKTRAEVRKHDHHMCSKGCYAEWMRREDVKADIQSQRVLREKCQAFLPAADGMFAAFHHTDDDILIFKSKEDLLEWKRTGLVQSVRSLKLGKQLYASYTGR